MFSGLTVVHWITNRCALPWGRPFLSIPSLPVVLSVGLRPPGLFSIHFGMSIVARTQPTFRQSCWRDFISTVSVITRVSQQTSDPLVLTIFQFQFLSGPPHLLPHPALCAFVLSMCLSQQIDQNNINKKNKHKNKNQNKQAKDS